jgi:uncharacterized membrane protein/YHS domain-containing protein
MILFLVHSIDAFLPLALCLGLLGALLQGVDRRQSLTPLLGAAVFGLLAGGMIYGLSAGSEQLTLVRTALRGVLLVTGAAALFGAFFASATSGALRGASVGTASAFVASLAAQGLFALRDRIYTEGLSATSVLNTELILNLGGLLSGLMLLGLLIPLLRHMALLAGRRTGGALSAFAVGGLGLLWGAEALLGLMRLQAVELTSARLSFVAVVTDFASRRSYVLLALILLLAALFLRRALAVYRIAASPELRAVRRKERSLRLGARRWFKVATAFVVLVAGAFLYHDLYASRPPSISEPTTVRPDSDGLLRFEADRFKDGRLHRFAYVMEDGKVIRFFLMNRFRDQVKIGVALDACLLCGDLGYIQEGENLICLACDVSIFVPSLGKGGGCNPIPLRHELKGKEILIAAADLEEGSRYFNEVRAIEVKDPVTGEKVTNTEAPYQYEFEGRTYFFGSESSWKQFRQAPEKYRKTDGHRTEGASGSRDAHAGHGGHRGHGEEE